MTRESATDPIEFETEVAIVGAGPTGTMLANLLGTHGVRTLLLECEPDPTARRRGVAIDVGGLRAMQAAGLYEALAPELVLGFDAGWTDARGRELFTIHLGAGRLGHPELSSCDQRALERVLAEGLERFPHVVVRRGHAVTGAEPEGRVVRLEGERAATNDGAPARPFTVRAAWVVACDGADSFLRRRFDLLAPRDENTERWLVIDAVDPHLADTLTCHFFCNPARPGMTLRLQHGRRRWQWRLLAGESDAEMLEESTLRRLLSPWTRSDALVIEHRRVHHSTTAVATRWRRDRVLLAGDAAHVLPAFVGRGLSAGLQDAFDLAWRLALVVQGRAHEGLLDAFEVERRRAISRSIRAAKHHLDVMQSTHRPLAAIRDAVFALLRRSPSALAFVQRRARRALRPPRLRGGTFVARADAASRRAAVRRSCRAGAALLQPRVRRADGSECLLDEVLHAGFAVLGIGIEPSSALDEKTHAFWSELGARFVCVVPPGEAPHGTRVQDVEGAFDRWLGGRREVLLMVRPDRVVAVDTTPEQAEQDTAAFRRLLDARPG